MVQDKRPFFAAHITVVVLAVLFFALRVAHKVRTGTIRWLEDSLLLVAVCGFLTFESLQMRMLSIGYGDTSITKAQSVAIAKYQFFAGLVNSFAQLFSRIAVVLSYSYLFPRDSNHRFCGIMMTLIGIYLAITTIIYLTECKPIPMYWKHHVTKYCMDSSKYDVVVLCIGTGFDLVIFLWPAYYLYILKLPLKSRLRLIVVFSFGVLAVGASVTRIPILVTMYSTQQYSRYGVWGNLSWGIEVAIGIICASLPYLNFVYSFFASFVSRASSNSPTDDETPLQDHDAPAGGKAAGIPHDTKDPYPITIMAERDIAEDEA